jgi:hypothetical protein
VKDIPDVLKPTLNEQLGRAIGYVMIVVCAWCVGTMAMSTWQAASFDISAKASKRWADGMDSHVSAQYARSISTTFTEGPMATTIGDRLRDNGDEARVIQEQRAIFKAVK